MPSGQSVRVTFEFKGAGALARQAQLATARVRAAVSGLASRYALRAQRQLKRELASGGTGKTYQRGGVTHQASAPGESPATDTGRYASNIRVKFLALGAKVITDLEYAEYLERGTGDIEPRPMWQPVFKELSGDFIDDLERAILNSLS